MKKIMIIFVFLSLKLSGMSEAEYQDASQERNERIVQARLALAPKKGERSVLESKVESAKNKRVQLQKSLTQEQEAYNGQCIKLQEEIEQHDPALIPSLLAKQFRAKETLLNTRYEQARQEHEQKRASHEKSMQKSAQKKEKLLVEIEKLQDLEGNQPETLRKLQVCIALFECRLRGESPHLVQEAPPEYTEHSNCAIDGSHAYQTPNDAGASSSYEAIPGVPSAPPAYDEITREEK